MCIPTYNRPESLKNAIQSVLLQTFDDFELLIHDNSNSDESQNIVNKISDPRIIYLRHSENQGMLGNWNSLVFASTGKYIKFLNDDDSFAPNCLQKFHEAIQEYGEVATVTCRGSYLNENNQKIKEDGGKGINYKVENTQLVPAYKTNKLVYRTPTHTAFSANIARKSGGFTRDVYYSVDVYSFHQFSRQGGALFINEEPLVRFNIHGEQAGSKVHIKQRIRDLERYIRLVLEGRTETEVKSNLGGMYLKEAMLMLKDRKFCQFLYALKCFLSAPIFASLTTFYYRYVKKGKTVD